MADRATRLRDFFEVPLQYGWVTLLVPSLVALKFTIPGFDTWHGYPAYPIAWIVHAVSFALIVVPIQLTYAHLPERWQPEDPTKLRALPFHFAVIGFWAVFGSIVSDALVSPLYLPESMDPTGEWKEAPGIMAIAAMVGTPIVVRGAFYRERLEETRTRAVRAESQALTAQVQALQARIEPHFLFNSLNAVASLIGEDPRRAERALERVADLFRYALEASSHPLVPLADEIESVESFLELEKLRFPNHLETSVRVEAGTGHIPVPPLFLQPLVENAVAHGIAQREEGGRLELEIARQNGSLHVRVEDDGPGPGASPHRGSGSALSDLRKRLSLLYDDRALLEVDRGNLGGYRIRLEMPVDGGREET